MINEPRSSRHEKSTALAITCAAFGAVLLAYLGLISMALPGWTTAKAAGLTASISFIALALIAWRTRQYGWVAHGFIFAAQLMAFLASITNGGLTGYVAPFQIIAPLAAGYFLSARAAALYGAVSIGFFGLLLMMDLQGWVQPTPYPPEAERIAALILLVTTTILGLICVVGFARASARMLDEAQKAERAKAAFLANMSHEIRTPMNGILGVLDIARSSADGQLDRAGVETVHASANTLVTVLNDILDVSKIDQGAISISPEPTDFPRLCENVLQLFSAQTSKQAVTLSLEYDPAVPTWLNMDPSRVRQVLWNLVGNAVKFTEAGQIRIRVRPADAAVRVEVCDTGIGMSEDAQARIFDRFAQADETTTRHYGGTGLGLTICRELIELMDGELGVESRVGEGSTFHFTISVSAAQPAHPLSPTDDTPSRQDLHVLIVDDQGINRSVAAALLSHLGHSCALAESGEEAIALAETDGFDIILMDIHMPGLDGLDTTREIRRASPLNAETPIIALTASALDEDRAIYLAAGMDGCLSKPVRLETLAEQLGTIRKRVDVSNSQSL